MKTYGKFLLLIALFGATLGATKLDGSHNAIPMQNKGAGTYYVNVHLEGVGMQDFLVDTGSSYTAINEKILAALKEQGQVKYLKDLAGVMADGGHKIVPLYRLSALQIGDDCFIPNVEIAVFPGEARPILGLSALYKAAPFVFSTLPPSLILSHCNKNISAALTNKKPAQSRL